MPVWSDNTIMLWNDGGTWKKISDHNRSALSEATERIENKSRMADGTLRRYTVTKKRTWSCSWDMLPSTNLAVGGFSTADGGWAGKDMEDFHNRTNGAFLMRIRDGAGNITEVNVMISDYSKEIIKRGVVDFWNVDITLEEV